MRRTHAIAVLAVLLSAMAPLAASAASDNATYTYDLLSRLTSVTYANGTVITFNYDTAGNRTTTVVTGTASPLVTGVAATPAAQLAKPDLSKPASPANTAGAGAATAVPAATAPAAIPADTSQKGGEHESH